MTGVKSWKNGLVYFRCCPSSFGIGWPSSFADDMPLALKVMLRVVSRMTAVGADEPLPVLSLFADVGGVLASREWERAIKALMRQVGEACGEYASPLRVGVTCGASGSRKSLACSSPMRWWRRCGMRGCGARHSGGCGIADSTPDQPDCWCVPWTGFRESLSRDLRAVEREQASRDRLSHGVVETVGAVVLLALMVGVGAGGEVVGTGCGGTVVGTGTGGAVVGPPGGFASGDAGAGALAACTGCGGAVTVTVITGSGATATWCATGRPGAKLITGDGASTGAAAVLVRTCVTVRTFGLACTISRRIRPGE